MATARPSIIDYVADNHKHAQAGEAGTAVTGSYSFTDADGKEYTISYVADENGYRATGDHLPVAPEVPEVPVAAEAEAPAAEPVAAEAEAPDAEAEAPAAEPVAAEAEAPAADPVIVEAEAPAAEPVAAEPEAPAAEPVAEVKTDDAVEVAAAPVAEPVAVPAVKAELPIPFVSAPPLPVPALYHPYPNYGYFGYPHAYVAARGFGYNVNYLA